MEVTNNPLFVIGYYAGAVSSLALIESFVDDCAAKVAVIESFVDACAAKEDYAAPFVELPGRILDVYQPGDCMVHFGNYQPNLV